MKNKNGEPTVDMYLPNGTRILVVSLDTKVMPMVGADTMLQLVKDPTEALRPQRLEIKKTAEPGEVLKRMAENPRANLYLV